MNGNTDHDPTAEDLEALTFEVAERIAQYLLDNADTTPDIPQCNTNARAALTWAAFQIRTNAWREGWERDPADRNGDTP